MKINKLIFGTGGRFGRFKFKEAKELVDYALLNGINKFDTGFTYGNNKSQPLLAKCLEKNLIKDRESIILSTKCAPKSADYINKCVNLSIENFNSGYLDYFHLWGASIENLKDINIMNTLKNLIKEGKIKNACVTTQDLRTIQKISSGCFDEISGLMLDFNLIQQNRLKYIKKSNLNNIKIFAGTSLCQGFLIESVFKMYLRTKSPFYLLRAIYKAETKMYLKQAKLLRSYIKKKYKSKAYKIPLSFVLNEFKVDFIPIGMLSKSSIKKNIDIVNDPIEKKITKRVANWAYKNSQLKEFYL